MFFKAVDDFGTMRWSELRGDTWVNPITGSSASEDRAPAVCEPSVAGCEIFNTEDGYAATEDIHNGLIHLAYRSRLQSDDQTSPTTIIWGSYDGTTSDAWVGPHNTGILTTNVPAITSDGTNVYMAWRRLEDDHIAWSVLVGSQWREPRLLEDRHTSGSPALGASAQGQLVMTWVSSTDDQVYWSRFHDDQWDAPQVFTDRRAVGVGLA